jgi:signal transduction histidine kinase
MLREVPFVSVPFPAPAGGARPPPQPAPARRPIPWVWPDATVQGRVVGVESMTAPTKQATAKVAAPDAERRVAELSAELAALRRQVVALQRVSSLGVLAGSVCHELNNALTPVLSYAKLGLRNPDPAFRVRAFEKILDGAQRASTITGGVLGLARPRADRRSATDLSRLTQEVLNLLNKDLSKARVQVDYHSEGSPHARIIPAQIQQVLLNLIINARQAMPGGGTVKVRVQLDPTGQQAELSIGDTGTGIAPDDLRRIFDPFFTTKLGPDETGMGGTGLGLSVCRDIVESHRGRLRAESRPNQGTTFTLILPACPAPLK